MKTILRNPLFIGAWLLLLLGVCAAYSGHYNNPFHFDDDHTIVKNHWIRELDSFPRFFTDSSTSSSLPRNQAYRPGVTLLHAIDYRLSIDTTSEKAKRTMDSLLPKDPNFFKNPPPGKTPHDLRIERLQSMLVAKPFVFHVHIFIGFVLSGFLLYFVLLYIFRKARPGFAWNEGLALFGMGWFWLHTANAETINYISARSDSASTFWILLTFVLYFYSKIARRYFLYLLPMIFGFFIKEPAIMFAPLLLFFMLLFDEEKFSLTKARFAIPLLLTFSVAAGLYYLSRQHTPVNWDPGGTDPFHYLLTQAFVIVHYCYNFVLPVNLSADTDWAPVISIFDDRVLVGGIFIGLLVYFIVRCWKRPEWRPVSFGLIWFFIALAPTSSIFPFFEVLNDHRTYFPYIGLIMASTWAIGLWASKWMKVVYAPATDKKAAALVAAAFPSTSKRNMLLAAAFVFLTLHGIGAYVRCNVWSSGLTLWEDCVKKSPNNGRAWMQYGMSLVDKSYKASTKDSVKYWRDSAEVCYRKSQYFLPRYSYLFINWGILQNVKGNFAEAETDFRNAMAYEPGNPETYYFLGDFLRQRGKTQEALEITNRGLQISPDHENLRGLFGLLSVTGNPYVTLQQAQAVANAPGAKSDAYLSLSLAYYNTYDYENAVAAAQKAFALDTVNFAALNNICSANNQLGRYDAAIVAGQHALRINPYYDLGKGNLNESLRCKRVLDSLNAKLPAKPSADDYLNLSLSFYYAKMYARSAEAAQQALALRPNDATAWNNICTSYNSLKWYDKAVEAGHNAIKIAPQYTLAINNLNEALRGQQAQQALKNPAPVH